MEIAAYIALIFMGIMLGLLGGGGSILTVPILVYLFGKSPSEAIVYSLFIVGLTSLGGSVSYFRKGQVRLKTALIFGIPSVAAVFLVRWLVMPLIPEVLFQIGTVEVMRELALMILFAALMLFTSYNMLVKKEKAANNKQSGQIKYLPMLFQGILVGTLTGLIGAGGGFLIIPVLTGWLKLPMKTAVGTSLVIVSINSLTGFLFSTGTFQVDWPFLLISSSIGLAGVVIGTSLAARINSGSLRKLFGGMVLLTGTYILLKEIFF